MVEAQHTPGPWSITSDDGSYSHITAPDADDPEEPWNVALAIHACGYPDDPRTGCTEANARLIAAAPDLLEALKLFRGRLLPYTSGTDEAIRKADAAIAKAQLHDGEERS